MYQAHHDEYEALLEIRRGRVAPNARMEQSCVDYQAGPTLTDQAISWSKNKMSLRIKSKKHAKISSPLPTPPSTSQNSPIKDSTPDIDHQRLITDISLWKSSKPSKFVHTPKSRQPRSPFNLIQEILYEEPWKLLLATIFLNRTPGTRALALMNSLIQRYPTLEDIAGAEESQLAVMLKPLGLQNRRAARIIAFAKAFLELDPDITSPAQQLPGIGKYGEDSWLIWCTTKDAWKSVESDDKELSRWLKWRAKQRDK